MKMTDVAREAGVSQATVSRVLNRVASVNPEYRARVLTTMRKMGYRPNRLASNLRRRKTKMIGVVVSDIENPHFTRMVRVIQDEVYRTGYRVLLCSTEETAQKQSSYLEVLAAERISGVILSPTTPEDGEISELLDLGIPVVAIDGPVKDPRADTVEVDNTGGVRRATELLVEDGHQRVGFVGGPTDPRTGTARLDGYEAAMRDASLSPCSEDGEIDVKGGAAATECLLRSETPPTALIVSSNLMTIGALRALRTYQVRVPEDLALVAVDDPFWAEFLDPPLTTIAQPVDEMGREASKLLFERIGGRRQEPRRLVFDMALKVRESCGTGLRL